MIIHDLVISRSVLNLLGVLLRQPLGGFLPPETFNARVPYLHLAAWTG
jgi:hypothetical protein